MLEQALLVSYGTNNLVRISASILKTVNKFSALSKNKGISAHSNGIFGKTLFNVSPAFRTHSDDVLFFSSILLISGLFKSISSSHLLLSSSRSICRSVSFLSFSVLSSNSLLILNLHFSLFSVIFKFH